MTRSHAARCGLIYRENYGGRNAGRTGRNDQNRETGKRRPSGFKNGVIIGLVLGLLITGIGAGVGIRAYANLTNNYVIFGPQGVKQTAKDNVLDQAAIKKVDELLSYIDLYYNDSYKEKDIRNAIYKGTLSGLEILIPYTTR